MAKGTPRKIRNPLQKKEESYLYQDSHLFIV